MRHLELSKLTNSDDCASDVDMERAASFNKVVFATQTNIVHGDVLVALPQ